MPKVIVTPEVLEAISQHVLMGRLFKLKINRYKSGQNKGKLYAEYSVNDNPVVDQETVHRRTSASSFLNKAAHYMRQGSLVDIVMHKKDTKTEEYMHRMELGGK